MQHKENNFQEVRCERVFESMRLCCIKFKPQSLVCSGYDLEPRQFAPDTEKLDKSKLTFTVLGLGIFFSKPLYDIFLRPREPFDYSEPPTTFTKRQSKVLNPEA
ncbi:hypothetical protein MSG28_015560 [Choristoneura fumiferana]|uniref:Uncharacterized protein n=1 Tax=Choristoneura fumiferana TaxID=7141 RepID=A0ACC0KAN9_CHOFU|nr:hypothetical protein MSG28_015560 [Choristoneura fumiferana]